MGEATKLTRLQNNKQQNMTEGFFAREKEAMDRCGTDIEVGNTC